MNDPDLDLGPEFQDLIDESRRDWRPPTPADAARFQAAVDQRIRRRNVRNAAVGAVCVVALTAVVFAIGYRDRPSAASDVGPAEVASSEFAPAASEPASVPQELRPAGVDRAGAALDPVAAADRGVPDLGPSESEIWFARPLGAPPSPADLPAEYGALGALYLSEVQL